jgi:uracil-DNA glycosylase
MPLITDFFQPKVSSKRERERGTTSDNANPEGNDVASSKRRRGDGGTDEVEELLSFVDDQEEGESVSSWKKVLVGHARTPGFVRLAKFVAQERSRYTIYPKAKDVFSSLNLCPLHQVKVVIVGQDPYHGPNQAHGLCFSVLPGQAVPPSLRNIYKELREDPNVNFQSQPPNHGHLIRWATQGVLLLNTVLTVRKGEANSHQKRGWEAVTDEILRAVDRQARTDGRGRVFLLWGNPATAKTTSVLLGAAGSHNKSPLHTIICTSHPSPLGATKTKSPFLGSRCFSRCNKALEKMGMKPIDWSVDGPL